jgi:uncharacterized protein with FMN-binding domain
MIAWVMFIKKFVRLLKGLIMIKKVLIQIVKVMFVCTVLIGLVSCVGKTGESAISARELKPVKLLKPQTDGGGPLMRALQNRKSSRSYSKKKIPIQVLSNLLWAAFGINRPDSGRRTAPSALDWKETDIYVAFEEGIYLYDAESHMLNPIVRGDFRAVTGVTLQPFVKKAPVNLIYVADYKKMGILKGNIISDVEKDWYVAADTGFIAQNVYLLCASEGLSTVVRGLVNRAELRKIMNLRPEQKITLAQTVGYPKDKPISKIGSVLLKKPDGKYRGTVEGEDDLTYEVEVTVKDHQIQNIDILNIDDNEYAEKAKAVVTRVLKSQSTDVDAVTGATMSSEALLDAIEKALNATSQ